MSEAEEEAYTRGSRAAWQLMLGECLKNLGYDGSETARLGWITEREAAVAALRSLCGEWGDNDWADNLHLADVIEKHLARHLDERETEAEDERWRGRTREDRP